MELEIKSMCKNFTYLPIEHSDNKDSIQRPLKMTYCILHTENRLSETILTCLFQQCLTKTVVKASHRKLAINKMDEAVTYTNTKALNGSDWTYKFKEKPPN